MFLLSFILPFPFITLTVTFFIPPQNPLLFFFFLPLYAFFSFFFRPHNVLVSLRFVLFFSFFSRSHKILHIITPLLSFSLPYTSSSFFLCLVFSRIQCHLIFHQILPPLTSRDQRLTLMSVLSSTSPSIHPVPSLLPFLPFFVLFSRPFLFRSLLPFFVSLSYSDTIYDWDIH